MSCKKILFFILFVGIHNAHAQTIKDTINDLLDYKNNFAHLDYYAHSNKELSNRNTIDAVLIGNSITEMWYEKDSLFFKENNYVDRGISGQTSSQILLRFRQDVIDLRPKAVVILCGINDIAENTGPISIQQIANNIFDMAELANVHHIKVLLCSVLPSNHIFWNENIQPEKSIAELNKLIKHFAYKNHFQFINYYDAMVDGKNGLQKNLTIDDVHCNINGYKIMESILTNKIKTVIKLFSRKYRSGSKNSFRKW